MKRRRKISRDTFLTPIKRKPSLDLSVAGMIFSIMMLFMGLAAINVQANLLFGIFGLMIGVLFVSWFISHLVLKKLTVRRILPDSGVVGSRLTLMYEFVNRKRYWPSLSVQVSELAGSEAFAAQPHAYLLHAAGGMTTSVPAEVIPKRRGPQVMDNYQVSTSFPFGFIKRAQERTQRDTIIIYPAMSPVDPRLLMQCKSAEKSGANMRPRKGGMDEFYGVKEYRQGDNPRWIHWRRSAKAGVLVSREMTQVAPPRIVLAVDTHASVSETQLLGGIERCIAMAGSVAAHALEAGLLVGIMAWDDGQCVYLPPQRGKRHRRDVLNLLSRLGRNVDHGAAELNAQVRSVLDHLATPVLFTPRLMQMSLGETLRNDMLILSEQDERVRSYFHFDTKIDFAHCMPMDQDPTVAESRKPRTLRAPSGRGRGRNGVKKPAVNDAVLAGEVNKPSADRAAAETVASPVTEAQSTKSQRTRS